MGYRLPSLNALRAFESVAREGSLTAAAKDLNVTPSSLSRHITLLEGQLGVSLFVRHGRGVTLTEKGKDYFGEISLAFQNINKAGNALKLKPTPSDHIINLHVYTTFATEWLVPRLPRFRAKFPAFDIRMNACRLEAEYSNVDLDIAMTASHYTPAGFQGEAIFESCLFPVCAPELLDHGQAMASPEDLANFSPIYTQRELHLWRGWCEGMAIPLIKTERGLPLESLSLTYQAARRSAGVALGQAFFVATDLLEGRLQAPLKFALNTGSTHRLLYRQSRMTTPAIAAFRDWIEAEARITQGEVEELTRDFKTFFRNTRISTFS